MIGNVLIDRGGALRLLAGRSDRLGGGTSGAAITAIAAGVGHTGEQIVVFKRRIHVGGLLNELRLAGRQVLVASIHQLRLADLANVAHMLACHQIETRVQGDHDDAGQIERNARRDHRVERREAEIAFQLLLFGPASGVGQQPAGHRIVTAVDRAAFAR